MLPNKAPHCVSWLSVADLASTPAEPDTGFGLNNTVHGETNDMEPKEILAREDNLSTWRLAALLTFNGFLMLGVSRLNGDEFSGIQEIAPYVGFLVSLSVLYTALLSANVKYGLHLQMATNGLSPITSCKSKYSYLFWSLFGPTIFCPLVFTILWVLVLFRLV